MRKPPAQASLTSNQYTVALTRERGKNDALRNALASVCSKARCVELPCVHTVEGPDRSRLESTLSGRDWSWIVLTSPEAASVFCSAWKNIGKPFLRAVAVGSATATALQDAGVEVKFVPQKATGRALVDEICPASNDNECVLYPASVLAGPEIVRGLQRKGYHAVRLNTYSTEALKWDTALSRDADSVEIITFGAPSAVKGWVQNRGVDQSLLVACIGETSRAAACEVGFEEQNVFYPTKPGIPGWVDAVSEAVVRLHSRTK